MVSRVAIALAGLVAISAPAFAEPSVKILAARVGYPDARGSEISPPICKFGAWVPVDVELELAAAVGAPANLVIETPDADGVMTALALPIDLASRPLGQRFHALGYIRPAAGGGETTVTVRADDQPRTPLSDPLRIRSLQPRAALTYIVLALGSAMHHFDLPRPITGAASETEAAAGPLRGGRVELAALTDVNQLPEVWFGYDAADLVVLSTSDAAFIQQLFANEKKRAALREWVARGGRLAISVGANAAIAAQLPVLRELLPFSLDPGAPSRMIEPAKKTEGEKAEAKLPLAWAARESSQTSTLAANLVSRDAFPVANFIPNSGRGRAVIPPASRAAADLPLVAVQAALGLGRVTAIGFDLDRPPFTDFSRQADFWDWVLRECGSSRASVGSEGKPRPLNAAPTDDEDEVAVALRTHIDTFDGIPVVSFGSVAFLIVLYILIIAPLEYYFLKRVFGRLELTWLTFPLIALTICIASFASASAMKGRELRVNKLDVVDITAGPGNGQVVGSTWFTVFSPRIAAYSVAIQPHASRGLPGNGSPLVGWFGGPRAGKAGLLRRNYGYAVHGDDSFADELDEVPVQVWSTKAFTASWRGRMDAAEPMVESRLVHPVGDPTRAVGTFVNRMPFDAVTDCVAFYAGQAYPVGTIVKGQEVRLVLDHGQPAPQWFQERGRLADLLSRAQVFGGATGAATRTSGSLPTSISPSDGLPLWSLLFHEAALRNDEGVIPRNASLRRLDQSWRLAPDNRHEVIVMGRVPPQTGSLGVGGIPAPSQISLNHGAALDGTLRQETYVRLYLSIQ